VQLSTKWNKKGIQMRTLIKLLIVLFLFTVCVPARGEILIYRKTLKGYDCNSLNDQWEAIERKDKGYLILEIAYNYVGQEKTIEVLNAAQIEYFGKKEDKWYEVIEHEFEVIRADNGKLMWILVESTIDIGIGVQILMLQGSVVDTRIGLGSEELREIPKRLDGSYLNDQQLSINHDIDAWTISLRLHSIWTKIANNPNRINGDFAAAVADVEAGLIKKGYEERL
jgi:hypothetical protein